MTEADWSRDASPIREFVALATADGYRPTSIDTARSILLRYSKFLKRRFKRDLVSAGWQQFAAYKTYLLGTGISRATVRSYLTYICGYYLLKAQATQDPRHLENYVKMRTVGLTRRVQQESWEPFSPEILRRIIRAARNYKDSRKATRIVEPEDYPFLMTLLYTGGRAQFYGLRVDEIDFERMEITTSVKGGREVSIPLHPKLVAILKRHLATRKYKSEYLFRHGHDPETRTGQKANRQNAWRACKRVQTAAGLVESVHPHRFRKTMATLGKKLGLDPQFLQAILAHESVTMTLDRYSEVELDDVKREFAKLDLCGNRVASVSVSPAELVQSLKQLAPVGKGRAWDMIPGGMPATLWGGKDRAW